MNNVERNIRDMLSQISEGELDVSDIGIDEDLTLYGLNSIVYIRLIVHLESEYEFEVDDDDLDVTRFSTLRAIVDYITQRLEGQVPRNMGIQ